jgi:hypothetical protein
LVTSDNKRTEIGPELLLNAYLRLGHSALIDSELKYFAPFDRITKPDLRFRNTLSWRLISQLTIDYEFRYTLVQSNEIELKRNEGMHRVLLRYSFSKQ